MGAPVIAELHTNVIDTDFLPNGIYYIKIRENSKISYKQLIKSN